MAIADHTFLHTTLFSDLSKWSATDAVFTNAKNRYPLVPLSKVLKRVKEPVIIEDDVLYKRITVRLYGKGIIQRDEAFGKEIGTKRQFVAHAGQLILSRIDARNGAFGIVPLELEGAIVTNDFWLFEVQNALPEYLMVVLSSEHFQKYWQTQSSGTTNRQRVSENSFLNTRIVLPTFQEQTKLIEEYQNTMKEAAKNEEAADSLQISLNHSITNILGVSYNSTVLNGLISQVNFSFLSRWDPLYLENRVVVKSKYPMVTLSRVIKGFLVDSTGESLRRNTKAEEDRTYQYIGMEDIEKNTGKRTLKEVRGHEILSQTFLVPRGYIIYGKLRPYLNKYWENTTDENIICSSEFFVFNTVGIEREYFLTIIASEIIQRQLPPLYSGARMPRITEDVFLDLQIPLPVESVQIEIISLSRRIRNEIDALRQSANVSRLTAKMAFETAVFG